MILSASRRTDIPAFYSDWLLNRLKEGFALTRNPFSPHRISRVPLNPAVLDAIVFWTKDAGPMMKALGEIDAMGYPYYFQYTITPYGRDVEAHVPDTASACAQFRELSGRLGPGRVIWRYDPVILNADFSPEWHGRQFETLCRRLQGATDTCIISFADRYVKTDRNAKSLGIGGHTDRQAEAAAESLSRIAPAYGIALKACCEAVDYRRFGIGQASCIDKTVLERICGCPLSVPADKNQRKHCGCVESVDIGAYDTCPHGCVYCYATSSCARSRRNALLHDPRSPLLTGKPGEEDTITERAVKSWKTGP